MSVLQQRIDKVLKTMGEHALDTFMVLVAENRRYLSGFSAEDTQCDESAGVLFINPERLILATDSRYSEEAQGEATLFEVVLYPKGLSKELPTILKRLKTRKIGFESTQVTHAQFDDFTRHTREADLDVQWVATRDIVENLRIVKDDDEIDKTRRALSLAEGVFAALLTTLRPGMTEKAVAWEMEKGMREAGAEALSFPTIVAAGPNSALPHAVPGDNTIQPGQPLLFDWGARLNGYCSDTSRTVVLGAPDATFQRVSGTVLDAQKMAIDAIRAGVRTQAVDAVARNHIEAAGFAGKFGHGLGHGTGLAIHEQPRLSPLADRVLKPGMICTVEPGIYLPGWGGVRIENQVVVRKEGAEVLNSLPTDPQHLIAGQR